MLVDKHRRTPSTAFSRLDWSRIGMRCWFGLRRKFKLIRETRHVVGAGCHVPSKCQLFKDRLSPGMCLCVTVKQPSWVCFCRLKGRPCSKSGLVPEIQLKNSCYCNRFWLGLCVVMKTSGRRETPEELSWSSRQNMASTRAALRQCPKLKDTKFKLTPRWNVEKEISIMIRKTAKNEGGHQLIPRAEGP